jgi:peptidoglycan/xylan/chitin deacetylase (PgdA/CDA1 family)
VTFDDGYADVLHEAAPLLERYGVPATVFIASDRIGRGAFWWDDLRRMLLDPGDLPARLELEVGRERVVSDLGRWVTYAPHRACSHRGWRSSDPPPTPRHALYQSLHRMLRGLTEAQREQTLQRLRKWAGRDGGGGDERSRALSTEEARKLASSRWIQIGAHTRNHTLLPGLESAERDREIAGSRTALEDLLGVPVDGFAYPYGRHDRAARSSVRRAGFSYACGVEPRPVARSASRWALPRVRVPDCTGEEFGRLLESV